MKMKTSELTGAALDWAVAKCEGVSVGKHRQEHGFIETAWDKATKWEHACEIYNPSTNWEQAGQIIEREKIDVTFNADYDVVEGVENDWMVGQWDADLHLSPMDNRQWGETPLIAAMRCLVAHKLGDEVDIPEELMK